MPTLEQEGVETRVRSFAKVLERVRERRRGTPCAHECEVERFGEPSGDRNPLHRDRERASRCAGFIVQGAVTSRVATSFDGKAVTVVGGGSAPVSSGPL